MIRLVATDMDKTFLTRTQDYDRPYFARLYAKMLQQQMVFVVASGNQYLQLTHFFPDYPKIIYIAENGAYVRDQQKVYSLKTFAPAVIPKIWTVLRDIPNIQVVVSQAKQAYIADRESPQFIAIMGRYFHALKPVKDPAVVQEAVLKFSIGCPPEKTQRLVTLFEAKLAGLAEPVSSGHGEIDLIQPGIHKAYGLTVLRDALHIPFQQMCAFGDGGNDIAMLRQVGLGVAMANAQPEVKAAADAVTGTNEASGVLTYLEGLLKDNQS